MISINTTATAAAESQVHAPVTADSFILEKNLMQLVQEGKIDWHTAVERATHPEILQQMKLGTYVVPSLDSQHH